MQIDIIGAGLAGCEAAYYLAERGVDVTLYEMRAGKNTPAHHTPYFAELVCSNSLKAISIENSKGLLKKEMELLGSLVVKTAYETQVPAGGALAVDRDQFAKSMTTTIENHPKITVIREEITDLKRWESGDHLLLLATGPLTSDDLGRSISQLIGEESLFFFDAAAPIVDVDSLNMDILFYQSRYDKGEADYLNAPMNREQYYHFIEQLLAAEQAEIHGFETKKLFEGCMPVEEIARRGRETLSFGPMKPVGLTDPTTDKRPFAVVQLRAENSEKSLYNLVGFQTRLKWGEQKRVFQLIPGLENAEFIRYGVMHRNTYLNFPSIIDKDHYHLKKRSNIFFAGQITGVEGYAESAASGIWTARAILNRETRKNSKFPNNTMMGALQKFTIAHNNHYQPMASNFGILPSPVNTTEHKKIKGKIKKQLQSEQALQSMKDWLKEN